VRNLKKTLKQKSVTLLHKSFSYWCEMEYNIFRVCQLARFGLLLTSGGLYFILIHKLLDQKTWKWFYSLSTAYFLPPAGKESVISIGLSVGIPDYIWGVSIFIFDVMVCTMVLTNWWVVEVVIHNSKFFNKWYLRIQSKIMKMSKRKYGKLLPAVLLLLMIVPFQGSGAIVTSIIGSSLGLKNKLIFAIVAIGSIASIILIMFTYYNVVDAV